MPGAKPNSLDAALREVALAAVAAERPANWPSHAALEQLNSLGTQIWLDTGNLNEAQSLWHAQMSALTTNNTLANQVVQTGVMDQVIAEAARELRSNGQPLSHEETILELGFVVNCRIALRLVEAFGARVSVELHPAVAHDIDRSLEFAERYYAVCPERFIVKIPLTPEGYCAVARARAKDIPINYTLGFSARQNYLAARLSNPTYCNVFLGRLNALVADNGLGDGVNVGEKATLATQRAILELRGAGQSATLLIAASMRSPGQVAGLAGVDVFTIPPKVVAEFMQTPADGLIGRVHEDPHVNLDPQKKPEQVSLLWEVNQAQRQLADDLVGRGGTNLTGDDLRHADIEHKTHLFAKWSSADLDAIRNQGKIPDLKHWAARPEVALDDLLTNSALQSFAVDQAALDQRIAEIAAKQ